MVYVGSVDSPTPEWAEWVDKREQLKELYEDPDWMLQAGLGDIEFEQDLYDAFRYSPYAGRAPGYNKTGEPYNALALKALRDFTEKTGEKRWLDPTPYSEQIFGFTQDRPVSPFPMGITRREVEDRGLGGEYDKYQQEMREWYKVRNQKLSEITDYMGNPIGLQESFMRGPWGGDSDDLTDLETLGSFTGGWPIGIPWKDRFIDINPNVIEDATKQASAGSYGEFPPEASGMELRNAIFDVYGHELTHGLDFEPYKTKDTSSVYNQMSDIEHPAIYENTGIFGLNPAHRWMGRKRSEGTSQEDIRNAIGNVLFYGGRSPMDEWRRYEDDTYYSDYPLAGNPVAQGYIPNRTRGAVGSQIPFGSSPSPSGGQFTGPFGTPNFGSRFEGPYGTPSFDPAKRQPKRPPGHQFEMPNPGLSENLINIFKDFRSSRNKANPHLNTGGLVSLVL